MRKITYISGGERSGKSSYAQQLALKRCRNPIYLATGQSSDANFDERIARHKADRGDDWELIEEPINISKHIFQDKTIVLDCVTLWLNNIFFANDNDKVLSLDIAQKEWDKFIDQQFELFVVSNELGMGVHGSSLITRNFVELQGWMNQYIASQCDEAWLMVSGMPLRIK